MDQNDQQLQSLGFCHRLFCSIMKYLAAQALKPVTLGPAAPFQPSHKSCWPATSQQEIDSRCADAIDGAEDSESLASVDIEDETSRLLSAEGGGGWYHQSNIAIETVGEMKIKAPRKMVSINDEPEIINGCKKKNKNVVIQRREDGELRPLRSILKVVSKFSDFSFNS